MVDEFPVEGWGDTPDWARRLALAREFMGASTVERATILARKSGVRWSELFRLIYLDLGLMAIIDPMHALYLGVGKRLLRLLIRTGVFKPADLKKLQFEMDALWVPRSVGKTRRKIKSKMGGMTAAQLKNQYYVYGGVMLHGEALNHLTVGEKKLIRLLVLAYRAWAKPTLGTLDIEEGHVHMVAYCKALVDMYGGHIGTINMHMACHIKHCMLLYGPFHAFSLFAFERLNGIVGAINTNGRKPEVTFMTKMCDMHAMGRDNILRPGMDPRARDVVRSALGMVGAGDSDDETEDRSHVRTCGAIVMDWAFDTNTIVGGSEGVGTWFGTSKEMGAWDPDTEMSEQLRGFVEAKHGVCLLRNTGTKFCRLALCGITYGSVCGSYRDKLRADVLTLAAPEVGYYTAQNTLLKRPWCARVQYYVNVLVWLPKVHGLTAADVKRATRTRGDCADTQEWDATQLLQRQCFNSRPTRHIFACLQWYKTHPSALPPEGPLSILEDYCWQTDVVCSRGGDRQPVHRLVPVQRIIGGFSRWQFGGEKHVFRCVPLPSHIM